MVVKKQNKIVPVCDLLTSQHDSRNLYSVFLNDMLFYYLKRKWPIFDVIVTDFSFAIITAICFGLNEITFYTYLQRIFRYLLGQSKDVSDIIILRICCSPFVKMIMRKLTKLKVQKNCRKVIVELVVILTGAKSLEDLKHLFGLFCIILLNKKKNKTVKDSLKEIKCMSDNSFINYDDSKQITKGIPGLMLQKCC